MKRLLILTPRFPYPVIGGDRLRIYQLCRALSQVYRLTLLSLCENQTEMDMPLPDEVFAESHRVLLPKWRSQLNTLMALPTQKPLQIAYYKSPEFANKVRELAPLHDASVSHLIRVGDYVRGLQGVHVLEMTDAISLNYQRVKSVAGSSSIKALIYSLEQKRLEKYERNVLGDFNFAALVSAVDRDFLYSASDQDKVLVCANGVDTDVLPYSWREVAGLKEIELVFIGNLSSLQNMDAAKWFAKEVLPALNKSSSIRFTFKVIGRISDDNKSTLNAFSNVLATGGVESVVDVAASGHIGVCPMRLGAGIQNKVLEYMSLGLPCITSTVGYEGIDAEHKKEILVADTVEQYVETINWLLADEGRIKLITEAARKFVEKSFSWQSRLNPFLQRLETELNRD